MSSNVDTVDDSVDMVVNGVLIPGNELVVSYQGSDLYKVLDINEPTVYPQPMFNQTALQLPYQTKYNTRQRINDLFLKVVRTLKTIEGPVSIYILKPTKLFESYAKRAAPLIVLFGDYHLGSGGWGCLTEI